MKPKHQMRRYSTIDALKIKHDTRCRMVPRHMHPTMMMIMMMIMMIMIINNLTTASGFFFLPSDPMCSSHEHMFMNFSSSLFPCFERCIGSMFRSLFILSMFFFSLRNLIIVFYYRQQHHRLEHSNAVEKHLNTLTHRPK